MTSRYLRSRPAGVSRRNFLGASVASGAALFTGGVGALSLADEVAAPTGDALRGDVNWIEKSIPQLQALMNSGARLTPAFLQCLHHRLRF